MDAPVEAGSARPPTSFVARVARQQLGRSIDARSLAVPFSGVKVLCRYSVNGHRWQSADRNRYPLPLHSCLDSKLKRLLYPTGLSVRVHR